MRAVAQGPYTRSLWDGQGPEIWLSDRLIGHVTSEVRDAQVLMFNPFVPGRLQRPTPCQSHLASVNGGEVRVGGTNGRGAGCRGASPRRAHRTQSSRGRLYARASTAPDRRTVTSTYEHATVPNRVTPAAGPAPKQQSPRIIGVKGAYDARPRNYRHLSDTPRVNSHAKSAEINWYRCTCDGPRPAMIRCAR
ncbi:unnamed protein product, partial [Iphiclides podalirius]